MSIQCLSCKSPLFCLGTIPGKWGKVVWLPPGFQHSRSFWYAPQRPFALPELPRAHYVPPLQPLCVGMWLILPQSTVELQLKGSVRMHWWSNRFIQEHFWYSWHRPDLGKRRVPACQLRVWSELLSASAPPVQSWPQIAQQGGSWAKTNSPGEYLLFLEFPK